MDEKPVDNITKILLGLFVGATVLFVAYYLWAMSHNADTSRLDNIERIGQLVGNQILQMFGLHSGLNNRVPFVSQMRGPISKSQIQGVTPSAPSNAIRTQGFGDRESG